MLCTVISHRRSRDSILQAAHHLTIFWFAQIWNCPDLFPDGHLRIPHKIHFNSIINALFPRSATRVILELFTLPDWNHRPILPTGTGNHEPYSPVRKCCWPYLRNLGNDSRDTLPQLWRAFGCTYGSWVRTDGKFYSSGSVLAVHSFRAQSNNFHTYERESLGSPALIHWYALLYSRTGEYDHFRVSNTACPHEKKVTFKVHVSWKKMLT